MAMDLYCKLKSHTQLVNRPNISDINCLALLNCQSVSPLSSLCSSYGTVNSRVNGSAIGVSKVFRVTQYDCRKSSLR